jgi:iron complex transport system substrate-binding protein
LLLLASLLAAVACDSKSKPAADAATPRRVVSLSPSTTEAMFAIGAQQLLVGRSAQCDFPDASRKLPSVGGFADPNVEAILALRPTLVIGSRGPAGPGLEDKLRGHGIATLFPPTGSAAEVAAMLRSLGKRFGVAPAAERVAGEMQARITRIESWAKKQKPVSAVMVFDISPVYVAGPGGFPDELLRLAGARNVIDRGGSWPTVDVERLLVLDPDVIIDAMAVGHGDAKPSRLVDAPGWGELRAVKEGRVRRLQGASALRPGPRLAEGLADVAHALHDQDPPP